MANQFMITGKTGPAQQLTTKLVQNVSEIHFDLNSLMLRIYTGGDKNAGTLAYEIGMDSLTSITCSISGSGTGSTFAFTAS